MRLLRHDIRSGTGLDVLNWTAIPVYEEIIPPLAASDSPGEPNRRRKASCSILEEITPESYPNRNEPRAAKAQQRVTRI